MGKRFGRNQKRKLKRYIRHLELSLLGRTILRLENKIKHGPPCYSQGYFVDQPQYKRWTEEMKEEANSAESHLVRPSPTGNAICHCPNPEDAQLIAESLNSVELWKRKYELLEEKYNRLNNHI